ncbi:hypothetical protein ACLOJK_026314 [Asimina triloba]
MANVTVAADGSGNFSNVGAALAVVPKRSHRRFVIYIKAGVYHENVTVQKDQTNVVFVGDGINKTVITASNSNASGAGTLYSPTVAVYGDGFTAQDITFENSAGPSSEQAVALMCDADRSTFYRCSFTGYQDTLFARYQQQFYRECDVYGTVDFIFGDAVAVFQNCNLYARSPLHGQSNVFTAQGRAEATGGSGTVFHNCTITAAPELDKSAVRSYLGRPWEKYSRTVVMQSFLDDLIDPKGWLEWNGTFALDTLFYAEYQNRGPGANTDNRVKWPGYKLLNSSVDAQPFTVRNFIQGDLWLPSTGVPFHLDLITEACPLERQSGVLTYGSLFNNATGSTVSLRYRDPIIYCTNVHAISSPSSPLYTLIEGMKIGNFEPGFLLFAAFLTIQIFARTINGDEGLIIKYCDNTTIPDYCIAVLESDKRSFSADLRGLVNISIHLSRANATNTYKFINETLFPNATDPPMLRQCLQGCIDIYGEAVDALSRALGLLKKGDYWTMLVKIGVAVDVQYSCEDMFIQFNVPVPPSLALRDAVMFNLTSVTNDLGVLLRGLRLLHSFPMNK